MNKSPSECSAPGGAHEEHGGPHQAEDARNQRHVRWQQTGALLNPLSA